MLVDTHAHLMDPAFGGDVPEVLRRASEAGVAAIVCVGYDEESSRQAIRLAETHPRILAAVGVHPNYAAQAEPGAFDRVSRLARHPRVVGVGETGLDNYRAFTPSKVQREWFVRHLDLALELDLPVIVHNRQADDQMAEILRRWSADSAGRGRGVLHCFSGGPALLQAGLAAGFSISFAGPLTYKNAGELPLRAVEVPLDRLLVETDCPYLTPVPMRGRRNEPAFLRFTAERLADLRGMEPSALARVTTENAQRVFARLPVAVA
jgi:TatD DNase family protein